MATMFHKPHGLIELDKLELLVVMDNETDVLSSIQEGLPQLSEVTHLMARKPADRYHDGHECTVVFDQLCCGCHGLSILVTGWHGTEEHCVLFDVGPYPDYWLDNARRLDIDLATIECIFLSHWHFDHSGGFPKVIAAITKARSARRRRGPVVVDLHPDRPDQRGIMMPNGTMMLLPKEPTLTEIADAGGHIVTQRDPHIMPGGFFFGSGAMERVTDYETGLTGHYTFCGDQARP